MRRQRGFTLLEMIITLVVAGVMIGMLAPYFGSSFTKSMDPVIRMQKTGMLHQTMENIVSDYKKNYSSNLTGLRSKIADTANNQYGSYVIVFNGFIQFNAFGTQNTGYDSNNASSNLLKVVIKDNDTGESFCSLFTK